MNPSAFPIGRRTTTSSGVVDNGDGMTLRDYFAAKVVSRLTRSCLCRG